MRTISALSAVAVISIIPGTILDAAAYTGEKLAKNAKVTIEQATNIALKVRPGKIADKELEQEKGGSGLRYSFDSEQRCQVRGRRGCQNWGHS